MHCAVISFIFLIQILGILSETKRHDGFKVLTVKPISAENEREVSEIINRYGLDVWRRDSKDGSTDVLISPESFEYVVRELHSTNTPYQSWIHNIQSLIDRQFGVKKKSFIQDHDFFSTYHTFEEITSFISTLTRSSFYGPSGNQVFVDYKVLDWTYEDNPIHMIKISKPGGNKLSVFVECGIHAREWISPAVCLYIINELVINPSSLSEIEELVDVYDWYFVPVLNPDGYIFTHTGDRLWRKNRRPIKTHKSGRNRTCHGVDLNRNFGFHWDPNGGGNSAPICSILYAGPNSFSEIETRAIRNFLLDSDIKFTSYISFHSYGQYWMYPWGYTSALPTDYIDLNMGAEIAAEALKIRYNTSYAVGTPYNLLYPCPGVSTDFTKGRIGIKFSYTCELRDKELHGFLLPEDQIIPTSQETMDSVLALMNYIKRSTL